MAMAFPTSQQQWTNDGDVLYLNSQRRLRGRRIGCHITAPAPAPPPAPAVALLLSNFLKGRLDANHNSDEKLG